jgi:uncharacterized membrane protein YcaP (DUF421 family)
MLIATGCPSSAMDGSNRVATLRGNLLTAEVLSWRGICTSRSTLDRLETRASVAIFIILRAAFGYLFLVLMVRIVGRRPGKQLTPFEFVLIFYLGGLTLTGMVGMEVSLTNAVTQILTVAFCHYVLAYLRFRYDWFQQKLDGSPLILLEGKTWRTETLSKMRIQDDDVMDMAREEGIKDLGGIKTAVLESFGEITIVPVEDDSEGGK